MPPSSPQSDLPAVTVTAVPISSASRIGVNRLWPRATTALLLLVGTVMGLIGFATVMSMGDMAWHGARDAELRATYDAYQETGTLLIKETGSGSYGVQAPADGPLTFATWDDDPGSYIIASLMYNITGSDSPYPGLKLAQALLVALPLVWLPLAVARIVGRARAGYALVLLPLVVWLFNHGATLVGTEYGLSDRVNTLPVYSLYGTAASLAFLSLSLIVLLSSYRLKFAAVVGASLGIAVLAAFGNMSRSLSGMGVAAAVGVLWWLFAKGRWRWVSALGGALATILIATVLQTGLMTAINVDRASTTGQAMEEVPDAHTAWHSLYLGLSYPTPLNGQPSHFAVTWADEFGWAKAREIEPDVLVASEQYDEILKGLYLDEVLGDPVGAVKLYVKKALYLAGHFGGLLLFIVVGLVVGMAVRSGPRPRVGRVLAIVTPLLLLGLVPAILVMPMLYYYSELAAALGMLAAVSLGVLVWALTSWPARIRAREARRAADDSAAAPAMRHLSIVLDAEGEDAPAAQSLLRQLSGTEELVLSRPDLGGVGARMREAVLRTHGQRVLIVNASSVDDPEVLLAPARESRDGATEHSDGAVRPHDLLTEVTLGSVPASGSAHLLLDGTRAREIARISKETSELWFDEMVFGAAVGPQSEGANVVLDSTVAALPPTVARSRRLTRFFGLARIALRREEYADAATR